MLKIFLATFIVLFSNASLAHSGHDHSHWSSNLTHLILALSTVSIVALGVYLLRRKNKFKKGE
ncbi:hypothetical protein ACPUVO_17290 [Pseudocolwellia sp. HL-MZ19]|uniref:hypothetical protein n=1 Tax=unclassified Pseudocolwellia TaxID=2848178 RepID=UPI003CEAB7B2